jgi:murein L,D-transpeptidase YafK
MWPGKAGSSWLENPSRFAAIALACLAFGSVPASGETEIAALAPAKADRVVVFKAERKLLLLRGDRVLREFRVALGRNATGHKVEEGDSRTPEGYYVLDRRLRQSKFHRAIHISYPDGNDRRWAASEGVKPGGAIMIHGQPNGVSEDYVGHPGIDWTNGCIAVTNREIDEIWAMVDDGTEIRIFP